MRDYEYACVHECIIMLWMNKQEYPKNIPEGWVALDGC